MLLVNVDEPFWVTILSLEERRGLFLVSFWGTHGGTKNGALSECAMGF